MCNEELVVREAHWAKTSPSPFPSIFTEKMKKRNTASRKKEDATLVASHDQVKIKQLWKDYICNHHHEFSNLSSLSLSASDFAHASWISTYKK